jgi:CheY-like chemotaxis protein
METVKDQDSLNLLLMGNNPIELSSILGKIRDSHNKSIITEIAFDIKSLLDRLISFTPNYIVIDDNIGRKELHDALNQLHQNRKTRNIPVTVLKNSNYEESNSAPSVLDYLLKQNLSAESLFTSIRNSLKFRKTQLYLYKAYKNRKKHLESMVKVNAG